MKSLAINKFQTILLNLSFIILLKELLFINLFYLGPPLGGCKLMKINTSFRIRGKRRNVFLHPLV